MYTHDITLAFSIHSIQEEPSYQEIVTGMLQHINEIQNSDDEFNFEIFFSAPDWKTI